LSPGGVAFEATVAVVEEAHGEDSATWEAGVVDRTRAAEAVTDSGRGDEADQVEHLLDVDLRADRLEIDPECESGWVAVRGVHIWAEQRRGLGP